jgi:photosystem II stability/assembly factor-like uncharacterized protein
VVGHDLYIADGSDLYVIRDVDGIPRPVQTIFTAPGEFQSVMDVTGNADVLLTRTLQQVFASHDGGATWQPVFTAPDDDPFLSSMQLVDGDVYVAGSSHIWIDHGSGFVEMPAPADEDFFHVAALGGRLLVSAEDTGLFLTADGGTSYRRVGLPAADVHALAVVSGTSLLAGTTFSTFSAPLPERTVNQDWGITDEQSAIGERVVSLSVAPDGSVYSVVANAFSRVNIERSTDGGATWETVEGVRTTSRGFQVLATGARVYVTILDGQSPGVLVSRDGGSTWRKNDLPEVVTAIAADPTDPQRIWLGGPSGLYRSDDEGQTATQLSSAPVGALAIDPRDPSHLLVGGDGLFESHDGGRHLSAAITSGFRLGVRAIQFGPHGTVYAADAAASDSSGLPVGGRGVLASRDGGHSWQNVSDGLANLDVESLAVSPDGQWLYAGTTGGSVYRYPTG